MKVNLHSNMELLLQNRMYKDRFIKIQFTFQYGATSTDDRIDYILAPTKFTFQYGATST